MEASKRFVDAPRRYTVSSENRFLVVGSGSAGRRHALSLRELFPTSRITVVKRSQSTQPLALLHEREIEIVDSFECGIAFEPTFSVIASPATLHFADFEFLSRHCSRFLLEKPLASSTRDAQLIHSLAKSRGTHVVVGHHLRFSDTPLALKKETVETNEKVLPRLSLSYGQHLRHWRPGVPLDQTVTAMKSLGGGVLRELSHEIDAASFLASRPHIVQSAKLSYDGAPTDGEVETNADFVLKSPTTTISVHLDMTTEVPYRHWDAIFPSVTIRADLLNGTVTKLHDGGAVEQCFVAEPGERDRAAKALLRFAILGAPNGPVGGCDTAQGVHILNTIEAIEESAASGKSIDIAE